MVGVRRADDEYENADNMEPMDRFPGHIIRVHPVNGPNHRSNFPSISPENTCLTKKITSWYRTGDGKRRSFAMLRALGADFELNHEPVTSAPEFEASQPFETAASWQFDLRAGAGR